VQAIGKEIKTAFSIRNDIPEELFRIDYNGDVFYRGKLIENDKEIVPLMKKALEAVVKT